MIQKFLFIGLTLLASLVTRNALISNPIFTGYPINDVLGNTLVIAVMAFSIILVLDQ